MTILLHPGQVPLADLETIYWNNGSAVLDRSFDAGIEKAAKRIAEIAAGNAPVYGINTGFGKLASIRIDSTDVAMLQRNLILSHCCGVGAPLPENVVRLIMSLKLISLGRGASGVRLDLVRLIEGMLEKGVIPLIPEKGSVGASGDLAPLAHMAAAMMGEGEAFLCGVRMTSSEALSKAGLKPVMLAAKEGLALINGTQASTALALAGLFRTHRAAKTALVTGALSTDAAMGSSAPFHPDIHTLRGHKGQIDAGAALRKLLAGSKIRESHIDGDERVQDPYCIRCQPQVDGACLDLLRQVARTLEIEANAVTDNPLVLSDDEVVSGGNFHAEPVAFAADQTALAICEIGAIAQRRIALLVDPALSYGLPAFLSKKPGLNSGLMIAEVTSAALMSENKQMSHPASVDSTPTSANQEDHVSMACHGARRLLAMTDNLFAILGIEALAAVQGIELRGPLSTSPELQKTVAVLRASVPTLEDDRYLAPDLQAASELVASGALAGSISPGILPVLEVDHGSCQRHAGFWPLRLNSGTSGRKVMNNPRHNIREVRAPRGSELNAKSWMTEAPLRMLMNNLDPDVAENPHELVVYGGIGRAARTWDDFDRIVGTLKTLGDDETLLVQSGKPVGVFRTHKDAPRVLIANSNLVPHWATWDHFNELDKRGLAMYGQMTAGSWIYIGTQGIVQGTYETFVEAGRQHYGGNLKGRWILTGGLGGMGGAQPLAAVMAGACCLAVECDETRIDFRLRTRYVDAKARTLDEALAMIAEWTAKGEAKSVGLLGNAAEIFPDLVNRMQAGGPRPDIVTDQTSAHDPRNGYLPVGWTVEEAKAKRECDPKSVEIAARASMRAHVEAMVAFWDAGVPTLDYGNNIRQVAKDEGFENAFAFPGFVPAYIRPLFCRGIGPFRWAALSGDPEDIYRTDAKVKELLPDNKHLHNWLDMARERIAFQGLPARICWVGLGDRHKLGLAFNEMVRNGELSAPIVIGRDHLDSGSVASPNRETEAMRDGSDAVSDWPLLNALLNTASGATWVSLHHGGGVGMGFSQHSGMVICADGSQDADRRLERVLWNDPATGVMRHADAGYDIALDCAKEKGLRLPGILGN